MSVVFPMVGVAALAMAAPKDVSPSPALAAASIASPARRSGSGGASGGIDAAGGRPAAPPARGPGTWSVLVQPGKRWVLHNTFKEQRDQVIVVETYDVHQVGGANVGRLRWTLKDKEKDRDKDGSSMGSQEGPCFTRLAVNDRGLYILRDDMDDAAVAIALQGKPSRSDPPRPYDGTKKNHGRYLNIYQRAGGPMICLGEGPEPGAGDCDDTCFAEMCVSPTKGVVEVSGTAAPDNGVFAQPGFESE